MLGRSLTSFGWGLGLGCALLVASGCGGPGYGSPVKVSGTATVDDAPLANALVTFNCTEGREPQFKSFMATTGADGKYALEGIYPGPYEIFVTEKTAEVDPGEASAMAGQDLHPVDGELKTDIGADDAIFDIKLHRGRSPR